MRLITDAALAALTIWQEARGESQLGKVAVAEVILNRMHTYYSSDGTVAGTVAKALQFSGWNAKDPNRIPSLTLDDRDPTVAACLQAWDTALTHTHHTQGAVLYCHLRLVSPRPDWTLPAYSRLTAVIGHHTFFRPHHLRP